MGGSKQTSLTTPYPSFKTDLMKNHLLGLVGLFGLFSQPQYAQENSALPAWEVGYLDIHNISTGRGENMFFVLPDGTTLLVDAGELDPTNPRTQSARNTALFPNYTRPAHEWIVDYIQQLPLAGRQTGIDYALVTHYHGDHFGEYFYGAPHSRKGNYLLSGITGVYEYLPFGHLIDRGYDYPFDLRAAAEKASRSEPSFLLEYLRCFEQARKQGMKQSVFVPGKSNQIALLHAPAAYPNFEIRNVVGNGWVWTGEAEETKRHLPTYKAQATGPFPNENMVSCGFVLRYGAFRMASCADITGVPALGGSAWQDVESVVAPVIGAVDVCKMNHHGNRDAMNVAYLSALQPRVLIQHTWSSDHPGHEALIRMISPHVYPGARDLFATAMLDANIQVIGPDLQKHYKSLEGHVVIRVQPGGAQYYVYVLNHHTTQREVLRVHGPYQAKALRAQ